MAKKTVAEKAEKADKTDKASTSGEKGAGDKTPVENAKENDEQPVELGKACRSSFKLSVKSSLNLDLFSFNRGDRQLCTPDRLFYLHL